MTTQMNPTSEVPEDLRDLYDSVRDGPEARAAVGAYWQRDPDPTADGADLVRHRAALAVAESRREAYERSRSYIEAVEAGSRCPSCGGSKVPWVTVSGLCDACTAVDRWQRGRDLAEVEMDGTTRGALVAAYREEHPR